MVIQRVMRRMKLTHKLFLVITIMNVISIGAFTYFNYTNQKKLIMQGVDSKLLAAAQGLKIAMDNYHDRLATPQSISPDEYRKLLDDLSVFATKAGVKYAYTVVLKNNAVLFTSSSYTKEELEKGDLTKLFEPYSDASEGLKQALGKSEMVYDQYSDKWGTFRSVFLPCRTASGMQYAIGIDIGIKEIESTLGRTLVGCLLIGFCVFAVGTALALMLAWYIAAGIKRVANHLSKIADGNLCVMIEHTSEDEVGMLARDMNRMVENLRTLISSVCDASGVVVTAAGQFHATSENMSSGVEEVAAQAEIVATAAEEMASTSNEIASNCGSAAQSVRETEEIAEAAEAVVGQTVSIMNDIAILVRESAGTIKGLGASSDQIGAIISTIDDIADQTNLLALNAAIEAARAGEQGRGFAVVADEVRALAERTSRATQEISGMIKGIQQKISNAVASMESGVTHVAKGTEEAARSGEALQDILKHAQAITTQVNQVACSASEQTATTSEISSNIHKITIVARDSVTEVQASVAAASRLMNLAEELRGHVDQFRLSA